MNEIDFFLELLDIKGATKIMKVFNLNSKSKNLDYIKIQLRKILKGQLPGRKKNSVDPFEFLLLQFKNEDFEEFSENEFIQIMTEMNQENFPEYKKYLNYLAYFNEEAISNIGKMNENYNENKKIFKQKLYLDSIEEIKQYIVKVDEKLSSDFNTLKKIATLYLDDEEQEKFKSVNKEHEDSDLLTIYEEFIKSNDEKKEGILKLSYSMNNFDENDKVNKIIRRETIQSILLRKYTELKRLDMNSEYDAHEIERYKEENLKNKKEMKELNIKIRDDNKTIRSLTNDIKDREKENKRLLQELEKIEENKEKEIESLKRKNSQKIKGLRSKETNFSEEFIKINNSNIEEKIDKAFLVLSKYRLIDKIFPEVHIVKNDEFNISKSELLKLKVEKMYIQRQAMCSNEINILEKLGRDIGVEIILIECENEKKLIEVISCIKNREE